MVRIGWRLEVHNRDFLFGEKMKAYVKFVLLIFIFAACYGFVVPSLVSAKDSIAVLCGFVVALVIAPALLFFVGKNIFKKSIKKDGVK